MGGCYLAHQAFNGRYLNTIYLIHKYDESDGYEYSVFTGNLGPQSYLQLPLTYDGLPRASKRMQALPEKVLESFFYHENVTSATRLGRCENLTCPITTGVYQTSGRPTTESEHNKESQCTRWVAFSGAKSDLEEAYNYFTDVRECTLQECDNPTRLQPIKVRGWRPELTDFKNKRDRWLHQEWCTEWSTGYCDADRCLSCDKQNLRRDIDKNIS